MRDKWNVLHTLCLAVYDKTLRIVVRNHAVKKGITNICTRNVQDIIEAAMCTAKLDSNNTTIFALSQF
jgi:hypothetical protein